MKTRSLLALVALACLTAFAPAPFPRPERRKASDEVGLETVQGMWRVASMKRSRSNGRHEDYDWHITQVRVQQSRWEFLQKGSTNASYDIAIDNTQKPATIDFFSGGARRGQASGYGIIRRRGAAIEILYVFATGQGRARSFEAPPDNQWVLTLERQR